MVKKVIFMKVREKINPQPALARKTNRAATKRFKKFIRKAINPLIIKVKYHLRGDKYREHIGKYTHLQYH